MRIPIRYKILIVLLVVITTVLGMVTYSMGRLFHDDKTVYINDLASVMSRQAGRESRSILIGYQERIKTFAHLILDTRLKQRDKATLLRKLFLDSVDFVGVTVIENRRELITLYDNVLLKKSGVTEKQLTDYRKSQQKTYRSIRPNQIIIENSTISEQLPSLTIYYRPQFSKTVSNVISVVVSLDRLLGLAKRSDVMDSFLFDRNGVLLVHTDLKKVINHEKADWLPDLSELYEGKLSRTTLEYEYEGEIMLGGIYRVGVGSLLAGSQVPLSAAYLGARELLRELVLNSLALLIAAAIIGLVWARYFTKPIELMSKAAQIVGTGDFDVVVAHDGKDELGDLARSFNEMTAELKAREDALEAAQNALVQSEKMSAFGQMSAGFAHEVKNPLGGILGYAQLTKRLLDEDSPAFQNLAVIEKETKRCTEIVQNLMKFARSEDTSLEPIYLNDVVNESMAIVSHQLQMNKVKPSSQLAEGLPKILGIGNQLQQVLMNFAMNAMQAMEETNGGEFNVTTEQLDDNTIRLVAKDTGPGMTEEIKQKVFEPFFTTKEKGKGTGLGLAVTFGILREHKVKVNIDTEPGKGAAFVLDFPIPSAEQLAEAEAKVAAERGEETSTGTAPPPAVETAVEKPPTPEKTSSIESDTAQASGKTAVPENAESSEESTGESKDDFAARMAKLEADLGGTETTSTEASSVTPNTSEASTDETAESGESTGESKDDFAARMAKLEAELGATETTSTEVSSETTNTSEASTDETAESGESTGESKDDFAARMAKLEADLGGAEPVTIEASDETTNTSESRIAETDDSAESTGESKDDFTARMAKLEAELGGTEPVTSETSDETTNTSDAETTEAITLSQTNESISNTELIEEPQAPSSVIQTSPESSNTETDDSAISASTPESDETIDSATIQQATDETQINNIVEDRAQLSLPDTDAPQTSSSSIQTSSELSNLDSIESTDSISRIAPSEFITQDLQASLENETIDAIEAGHTDISKDTPSVSLDENEFTQDHETSFIAENHDQSILEEKDTITNSDITAQNHAVDEHGRFIAFSDEEYYDLLAQLYSEGDYANEDAVSSVSQAFVDTESRSNQSSANQDIIETTLGETANNTHSNSNLTQIAEANIPSDTTPSNENAVSEQEFKELFSDLLQTEAESSTASKEITQAELAAKTIKTAATEASVRVDSLMLDNIMNLVGELVLIRNQIVTLTNTSKNSDMEHSISQLDLLTGSLQDAVLKTRMQPIKQIFSRLPRVVRDTARKIGKEVFIHSHGDETELDKKLVELVADPIIHLVKNAIIHGIEIPEERVALNKAMAGTINISAINEADQIVLVIEDDGYGIDIERIRQRAIEIGLYNEAQAKKLSEAYLLSLLLNPEFATDPSTNDYSLSFINDQVNKLNGSITIETVLGKHTSIRLQIPLTLTILPALMVKSCNQIYALPLSGVCQIYNIQLSAIKSLEGEPVFVVRDKPIPIYFMHDLVGLQAIEHEPDAKAHVVTVDIGSQIIGVVVDDLIGQEEVVIKPLGNTLKSVSGVSGATITGGGAVALILELVDLVRSKRLAENEKKLKSKGVSNRHVHKQILRQLQKKYGSPEK